MSDDLRTGDKIKTSGYYVYEKHVDADCGAKVPSKARHGLYLASGSKAPDIGSCTCQVIWKLAVSGRE